MPEDQQIGWKTICWSKLMKHERAGLYSIGDFAGFCEHLGSTIKQSADQKKWRLMQVSDSLGGRDVELLNRMQIEIYRPLTRSLKFVPRKKLSQSQRRNPMRPMREKIEQLFPGYAFLTFVESDQRWREVFKMVGIRGLVCANNNPVDVPWKMIAQIQSREIDGAIPTTTKLMEFPFLVGSQVRVTDGPLASFGGVVTQLPKGITEVDFGNLTLDQLDESYRVHLLVDIFGRQTPVELGLSQVSNI
jgi:transcription antitermination factor NusG